MSILEVIGYVALGFILRRSVKSYTFFDILRVLANDILLSFLIFYNIATKDKSYFLGIKESFLYVPVIIALCFTLSFAYSKFKNFDNKWRATFIILSIYPNTAALGFPISKLFCSDITPSVVYSSTNAIIIIPIASFIAAISTSEKASIKESIIKTLKFPPTTASIIATFSALYEIKYPEYIIKITHILGDLDLPLLLVYFGSNLDFSRIEVRSCIEVFIFRMLVPFIFVILTLKTKDRNLLTCILIEASMPPAIAANAIISSYRLLEKKAINITFALTVLEIVIATFLSQIYRTYF